MGLLATVVDSNLSVNILDLCSIVCNSMYDLVYRFQDEVIVVIHHYNFGFWNGFDAFDLKMVEQKSFAVYFG